MSDKNINFMPEESAKSATRRRLNKTTKIGTYTFVMTLIVLAVIIIVNLLASALPKSLTVFDTSATGLYTISESTERFLAKTTEDVTLYWICQGGTEDETVKAFLYRYTDISARLSLKVLDPVANPTCLDKYIGAADSSPTNYSLIIESARRFKVVDFMELFSFYNQYLSENVGLGEVPYAFYEQYYTYFSYAESNGYPTEQFFCGDDTITKAVEYVTLEKIPHVYITSGHGEAVFSESLLGLLSNNNIEYEGLDSVNMTAVPADASCVVLYAPANDLSATETGLLHSYLKNGGNMLLITSPDNVSMPNLMSLMEGYGVSAVPGMVYEGNTGYYKDTVYSLRPSVNKSHSVTSSASSYTMLMPKAHGIMINDSTGSATVSSLFTTSDSAYSLVGEAKSDAAQMSLGVAITEETENGTTQIVWYSSADAFTDTTAASVSYGNYYYMFYTLYWMNETYESALSDVVGISLSEPVLDGLTTTSVYLWAAVFAVIIPLTVIIWGLAVWLRRRKR